MHNSVTAAKLTPPPLRTPIGCLGIIENMLELQPNLAERVAKEGDILEWLLKRVKVRCREPICLLNPIVPIVCPADAW